MLDKLELKTNCDIDQGKLRSLLCIENESNPSDRIYQKCSVYYRNNEPVLVLKSKPREGMTRPPLAMITLNPSKLGVGFESLKAILGSCTLVEELKNHRIDHYVDLNIPIEELHKELRFHYKRDTSKFSREDRKQGRLTGEYIGKYPEVVCIYDKAYELSEKLKLKKRKDEREGVLTRIEVRQKKTKIKHGYFVDLPLYLSTEVFPKCSISRLADEVPLSDIQQRKRLNLKGHIECYGIFNGIYRLNKDQNFQRDYGNFLETEDFTRVLNEKYWKSLSHFIT